MDCSWLGSSVLGVLQARIHEWVVISFSKGSSWPRNWTQFPCIAGRLFTKRATRKVLLLKSLLSMQVSGPRWNKASYSEAMGYFLLPNSWWGWGRRRGDVRGAQLPHLPSLIVNKELGCEQSRKQDYFWIARCLWKKLFQKAGTLVYYHTEKITKSLHVRDLFFLNYCNL